jgi:DNA polymerase III subunit delta'
MRFSDIPGLSTAKEKLYRTIQTGKIAHAQMFSGPEGSANLAMALAYASLLNCTNPREGDSCGECASCKKTDKLIHPDLHFVFPVSAAKNKTGKEVVSDSFIAEWRQFIIQNPYGGPMEWSPAFGGENKQLNISREESRNILRKLSLMSYEGEYKIMIIWLAEFLHASAANAILKLLEEPPEKTVFLLVTYDSEQIISTILSRVQLLKIRPFTNDEVAGYLTDKHGINVDEAFKIASIVSGDMNHAQKLISEADDGSSASFQEWMRICFTSNYLKMVEWADNFSTASKINQKGLFQYGLSIIRDALLAQNGLKDMIHTSDSDMKFSDNFAKALRLDQLEKLYTLLNTAYYHLERNVNPKITFLDTSLQISAAFKK